jgi:hypothetical protein
MTALYSSSRIAGCFFLFFFFLYGKNPNFSNIDDILQKVVYDMVDYHSPTKYDSVVRTCSSGPCSPITSEAFNACRGKVRSYRFHGCTIRTCCDENLCNSTPGLHFESYLYLFTSAVWAHMMVWYYSTTLYNEFLHYLIDMDHMCIINRLKISHSSPKVSLDLKYLEVLFISGESEGVNQLSGLSS